MCRTADEVPLSHLYVIPVGLILMQVHTSFDPRAVPKGERLDFLNRQWDTLGGPNAADAYERAIASYRKPYETLDADAPTAEFDAFYWVSDNNGALAQRDDWPPEKAGAIGRWLAANAAVLDALREATERPHYRRAFEASNGRVALPIPLSELSAMRSLARLAAVVAQRAAREGRWNDAYEWNSRVHQLGAHLRQVPLVIWRNLGNALTMLAYDRALTLLATSPPEKPAEWAERLAAICARGCGVERVDRVEAVCAYDDFERYYEWAGDESAHPEVREEVQAILDNFGTISAAVGMHAYKHAFASVDALRGALRQSSPEKYVRVTAQIDALGELWDARPLHDAVRALPKLREQIIAVAKDEPYRNLMESIRLVPVGSARIHAARAKCRAAALPVVVALRAYREQERAWPTELSAIAPRYLSELPDDPFSGRALVYRNRPSADGYQLYSVGPDGRDDGGVPWDQAKNCGDDVFWPTQRPDWSE